MIKLQFDEIKFNNKKILASGDLILNDKTFTILKGESGSGKSTLLQTLAFHNTFVKSYFINELELLNLSDEQRFNSLYCNMAFVSQQAILLEDLKIKDQIALVKSITEINIEIEKWITVMELENLLDKYPAQLSGGELKRASILLALVKYPKYLILDEPTASLDEKNREIIMRVLKEYVQEGNTVLVSTHDTDLEKEADVILKIENKVLHRVFDESVIIKDNNNLRDIKKNTNSLHDYFARMRKHRKKYTRIVNSISMLCIALVSFAFTFNNAAYSVQTKQMEEMQTKQIIVYKKHYETKIAEGYAFGPENIIEENEIAKLQKIDHIKNIDWRFDSVIFDPLAKPLSADYSSKDEKKPVITLIDKGDVKKEYYGDSVIESTYVKNYDYRKDVAYQFQEDGIYISSYLAGKLSDRPQDLKNKDIKTYLMVPIASNYGDVIAMPQDGEEMIISYPACKTIEVTLPIAGILTQSNMGIQNPFNDVIYIERNILEDYLKKEEPTSYDKYYIMDDSFEEIYVNELPKTVSKKPRYISQYSKWAPTAYTVTADNLDNMGEIIEDITKLGFDAEYAYGNYKAMSETTKNMQKGLKIASISIGAIVLLAFLVMKYNERDSERKINDFFYELLFTPREITKIKNRKFLYRSFSVMVWSCGFMAVFLIVCNFLQLGYTSFHWNVFLIIVLLSLLLEFGFPVLFERGIQNKKE